MSQHEGDFSRDVNVNCSRLLESYKTILKRAQVADDFSVQMHEELQLQTSAETIVRRSMIWNISCIFG